MSGSASPLSSNNQDPRGGGGAIKHRQRLFSHSVERNQQRHQQTATFCGLGAARAPISKRASPSSAERQRGCSKQTELAGLQHPTPSTGHGEEAQGGSEHGETVSPRAAAPAQPPLLDGCFTAIRGSALQPDADGGTGRQCGSGKGEVSNSVAWGCWEWGKFSGRMGKVTRWAPTQHPAATDGLPAKTNPDTEASETWVRKGLETSSSPTAELVQ